MTTVRDVVSAFTARFGGEPSTVVRSPGRVNLIGDHTDYNDGFVLPIAIDRAIWIASRPRDDAMVRVWSGHADQTTEFSLGALERGGGWSAYLQGVTFELTRLGVGLRGWDGVILSEIPPGAGLSSSAALELATAMTFSVVSGLEWDPLAMALLCQRAENGWVGVNCGIMDQLICATGQPGMALLIDCRDLSCRPTPIAPEVAVVVLDTGTRRDLVESVYNQRRASCETAARSFGVAALRDLDLDRLAAGSARVDPVVFRRVRHVVTENDRVLTAARLLEAGDTSGAGLLMVESHRSLRDDFEVSSPALDAMVEAALGAPGCLGARMTGAGLGGSCVALAVGDEAASFSSTVIERYHQTTGLDGVATQVTAVEGTTVVDPVVRS